MADLNFNAHEVEPRSEIQPLPNGQYLAVITESEMKPTKSGSGSYLQLTFEVVEGQHQGRKLWSRLNLHNTNSTAVQIARSELSSICRAVGVMEPNDSSELHDLPLLISVKCTKRKDSGDLTNEIRAYAKRAAPNGQLVAAGGNHSAPPWIK